MQANVHEEGSRSADLLSGKWQVSLDDPLHLLFDSLQVLFCDGFRHIKVVVKASLNSRTYCDLRSREQLLNSHGHDVRALQYRGCCEFSSIVQQVDLKKSVC